MIIMPEMAELSGCLDEKRIEAYWFNLQWPRFLPQDHPRKNKLRSFFLWLVANCNFLYSC